jgi:hypothetical protein
MTTKSYRNLVMTSRSIGGSGSSRSNKNNVNSNMVTSSVNTSGDYAVTNIHNDGDDEKADTSGSRVDSRVTTSGDYVVTNLRNDGDDEKAGRVFKKIQSTSKEEVSIGDGGSGSSSGSRGSSIDGPPTNSYKVQSTLSKEVSTGGGGLGSSSGSSGNSLCQPADFVGNIVTTFQAIISHYIMCLEYHKTL